MGRASCRSPLLEAASATFFSITYERGKETKNSSSKGREKKS